MNIKFGLEKRKEYDLDHRRIRPYGYTKNCVCKDCKNFYYDLSCTNKTYSRCKLDPKKYWPAQLTACSLFIKKYE